VRLGQGVAQAEGLAAQAARLPGEQHRRGAVRLAALSRLGLQLLEQRVVVQSFLVDRWLRLLALFRRTSLLCSTRPPGAFWRNNRRRGLGRGRFAARDGDASFGPFARAHVHQTQLLGYLQTEGRLQNQTRKRLDSTSSKHSVRHLVNTTPLRCIQCRLECYVCRFILGYLGQSFTDCVFEEIVVESPKYNFELNQQKVYIKIQIGSNEVL